jgi:7-carboxy-7-deazaguanine synthase
MSETKLQVIEIFDSIEGEGKRAGQLVTFIRLTGCNLRCSYCDTEYAFSDGKDFSVNEIMEQVNHSKVTLTGGEPLLQANVPQLLAALHGHEVNIETNGSINIEPFFV